LLYVYTGFPTLGQMVCSWWPGDLPKMQSATGQPVLAMLFGQSQKLCW